MRSCAFGRAHSEPSMTVGVECYGIRNASSPKKWPDFVSRFSSGWRSMLRRGIPLTTQQFSSKSLFRRGGLVRSSGLELLFATCREF